MSGVFFDYVRPVVLIVDDLAGDDWKRRLARGARSVSAVVASVTNFEIREGSLFLHGLAFQDRAV